MGKFTKSLNIVLSIFIVVLVTYTNGIHSQLDSEIRLKESKINKVKYLNSELLTMKNGLYELTKKVDKLENANDVLVKENEKLKENLDKIKKTAVKSVSTAKTIATYKIEATAYTAFCNTGCIGITATGKDVSNTIYHNGMRIIAVDPRVIPLHSVVRVTMRNGTTFKAIALDTGGAIKGKRLDLLVDSKDKAWEFGRQDVTVEVLKWG